MASSTNSSGVAPGPSLRMECLASSIRLRQAVTTASRPKVAHPKVVLLVPGHNQGACDRIAAPHRPAGVPGGSPAGPRYRRSLSRQRASCWYPPAGTAAGHSTSTSRIKPSILRSAQPLASALRPRSDAERCCAQYEEPPEFEQIPHDGRTNWHAFGSSKICTCFCDLHARVR